MHNRSLHFGLHALAALWLLCAATTARATPTDDSVWVVLGPQGQAVARYLTSQPCPDIVVDGSTHRMHLRAAAALEAQRPTASPASASKAANFAQRTCEFDLPAGTHSASIHGSNLPVAHDSYRRIVVIGDTGCRIKSGEPAQACNDPQHYPFAAIARAAARWHPDLVVHVGDYLYRENPCPDNQPGCQGSPWGYGSDSWRADFFTPARALLQAAPWVMVRGNHESCQRGGQGWWRFLDPRPLQAGRDCNLASNDMRGNFSDSYAVPLGDSAQIVVMDSAAVPRQPLEADDPRTQALRASLEQALQLTHQAQFNFLANHHPVLGFAAFYGHDGQAELAPGNSALQALLRKMQTGLYPASVDVLLSGHVHVWEQLDFSGTYPSQFIAGFSGTQEDIVPLPAHLPPDAQPAPGAQVAHFSSWVNGFGFMTMQRRDNQRWDVQIHDREGKVVNTCTIEGRHSQCKRDQIED